MPRPKSVFTCQSCGYQAGKWLGRCPDCGAWHSLVEEVPAAPRRAAAPATAPLPLPEISGDGEARLSTGMAELDRVLGGGLVKGSVVLIGGDPGIGKSTLLLQAAAGLSRSGPVLYVSGEESASQLRLRAERLGIREPRVYVFTETAVETICEQARRLQPQALIVDSIQTVYSSALPATPGSIGQVRESAAQLLALAKATQLPVFLIGHVTKEGAIAGPRVLEHMVDTVLYFEGERHHACRLLRAVKNRFGPTNELGIFEMRQTGLAEVPNPSAHLLAERPQGTSGSVVVASVEGTRPLLVELQALASPSGFGTPRRVASGVDYQRVVLLLAVLEKRLGLPLQQYDVYVNVVGGLQVDEPAVDLGVIAAVVSSLREVAVDPGLVVFGEVGLTGEVRAVTQVEARLREAAKLGFCRCLLPAGSEEAAPEVAGLARWGVRSVAEALEALAAAAPEKPLR
ncbi:MAG: DNA repair protein RadA [Candidatus Tectimicrobiota bacterium]|nr:MAG: DNA repair protein RadA [Candidatus Tectomicrobia bacterium]